MFACSPRPGANSDAASQLFAQGYASVAGQNPQCIMLREYTILPCIGCDACLRAIRGLPQESGPEISRDKAGLKALFGQMHGDLPTYGCPLAIKDHSALLLNVLVEAPSLCLVSPIYFYHLPALLKALLDRTQPFWHLSNMGIDLWTRDRTCHVILYGARSQGKRLFAGSLLTLKYVLAGLRIRLAEPVLFYGLDKPSALAEDSRTGEQVFEYGKQAARLLRLP